MLREFFSFPLSFVGGTLEARVRDSARALKSTLFGDAFALFCFEDLVALGAPFVVLIGPEPRVSGMFDEDAFTAPT